VERFCIFIICLKQIVLSTTKFWEARVSGQTQIAQKS